MPVQTSSITTGTNGNLSLDPNGTGKVVLSNEAAGGEKPLSVNNAGEVQELNTNALPALANPATSSDLLLIQSAGNQFQIAATELGGTGTADPTPSDVSASPAFVSGSGTQSDPYVCSASTVGAPGGTAATSQLITISNQSPNSIGVWEDFTSGSGTRFAQPAAVFNSAGVWNGRLIYRDAPDSTTGQVYSGQLKMGSGSVYFSWQVTQVANTTTFSPAAFPTASPPTVNYALDGEFGTATGTFSDGPGALTATGAYQFSVAGGAFGTSGSISSGQTLAVRFNQATVDAAAEGATISGTVTGQSGFLLSSSFIVSRTPTSLGVQAPSTNQPVSSVVTSTNVVLFGINALTSVKLVAGNTTLTSVEASINGGAFTAIPTSGSGLPYEAGQSLIIRGTTGATVSTTYTARLQIGTATGDWNVTTAAGTPAVAEPTINSPTDGSTGLQPTVNLVSSTYTAQNGAAGHASSDWQVYEANLLAESTSNITQTNTEQTVLTLADSTNLSQFINGGIVQQNGGATPATTNIINVQNVAGSWTGSTAINDTYFWDTITWIPELSLFSAAGRGTVSGQPNYTIFGWSSDGSSWNLGTTSVEPNGNTRPKNIAWSPEQNIACAMCQSNDGKYYTSTDGKNWTQQANPGGNTGGPPSWGQVAWSNEQDRFVAAITDGGMDAAQLLRVAYSFDGTNWTGTTPANSKPVTMIWASGLGLFISASATQQIQYSTDGVNWTNGNVNGAVDAQYCVNMAYSPELNVVVGVLGQPAAGQTRQVIYSEDGITWENVDTSNNSNGWQDVTWSSTLGTFVAVADFGAQRTMYSKDGKNWTGVNAANNANDWTAVAYSSTNGLFAALASGGVSQFAMTSPTGGPDLTELTFPDATNLKNLRSQDAVAQDNSLAAGTISGIFPATNKLQLVNVTGVWTANTNNFVLGPTLTAALGTVVSVNTSANQMTLSDITGRWLVTEPTYNAAKKLNKKVTNPSVLVEPPGAPTTDPPDASTYTAVVNVSGDTTNKTAYPLTTVQLDPQHAYYSRVRYNSADGTPVVSPYSAYNEFATGTGFTLTAGEAYEGGYYAGQITDGGTLYNLVVAPLEQGALQGSPGGASPTTVNYKGANTADLPAASSQDVDHGAVATVAFADGNHGAFDWCINDVTGPNAGNYDATNALGTGIGGYNDWYVPSKNELAIAYFFLKPGSQLNSEGSGASASTVAPFTPSTGYSLNFPAQTAAADFQAGNSEAFDAGQLYWSSTESATTVSEAFGKTFESGNAADAQKTGQRFVRAMRRVVA